MTINIIGNLNENKGLAADARLLREYFQRWGHTVYDVQHDAPRMRRVDLNVFLEVCRPGMHKAAPRNVCIPNIEWWWPEHHEQVRYDAVWCKTHDALDLLRNRGRSRLVYTGFTTKDVRLAAVERLPQFLHVAGGSRYRNTDAVVDAWQTYWCNGQPKLTVVAAELPERKVSGVRWIRRIDSRREFLELFNAHLFHILPSQHEGYGVALWEARSAGAVLITTDAAPMNEGPAAAFVPPTGKRATPHKTLVRWNTVSKDDVWEAVQNVLALSDAEVSTAQRVARETWENENAAFERRMKEAFGAVTA